MRSLIKKIPGLYSLYLQIKKLNTLQRVDIESLNQQLQQVLFNQHQLNLQLGKKIYGDISQAGFRCYSQFEEDGILLYILSIIGMKTKKAVEISIGSGDECMAANLILNHGYQGFLFDGDDQSIKQAEKFFRLKKDCLLTPPIIRRAWVTKNNINELLREIGAQGEVDVLSLDIDGNDYYIWEAITEINPRLCIFETHNVVPDDLAITIPYEDNFDCWSKEGADQDFRGASLLAMKKLSTQKGYRLIGAHKHGFNVFFLRNDIAQDFFPEVSVESVHTNLWTQIAQKERWPSVKDKKWVKV
jgi:hypothetical protein